MIDELLTKKPLWIIGYSIAGITAGVTGITAIANVIAAIAFILTLGVFSNVDDKNETYKWTSVHLYGLAIGAFAGGTII